MTEPDTRVIEEIPSATAFLQRQLETINEDLESATARALPRNPRLHVLDEPLRVALIALDAERMPVALDLYGGVTLGQGTPAADVDLSLWGAPEAGVSHEHALLRPRPDRLYIIDRESTNGTFKNGLPLSPSRAYEVESGDVLTLGHLHIGIEIA